MTDKPLDTYIKSPPPIDEKSHYTYLEDQLTKIETASKSHVVRIADNNTTAQALIQQESTARVNGDNAQATYTQTVAAQTLASAQALVTTETTARTTADSALASSITSLTATVGSNSSAITSEASARATADSALGSRIDNLVLTTSSSAAVIIDSEATARVSADTALGARIDNVTSTVNTNTAAISTEQTTRATRDDALATQLFTMSSGSSRVYVATSAPSSTGRQPGDVWFDSSTNNYKPYVWARSTPSATTGTYDWRDNSNGSYSNNVGNYAVYTSNISTLTSTVGDSTTGLVKDVGALKVAVGDSTAGLTHDVSALVTTVGGSTSGLVQSVNSLNTTVAQQRIYRQNTAPTSADRKVGDLWYDTSNGNAPYFWNGTSWIVNTDTTRASSADLTTEQSVRSTADSSLASYIMTASAGTSRVYTSDPGTSGRQNGDTWFKTTENFKPYVWYNSQWNDNSSGAYTQYVGQIASVTTTANAAYTNAGTAQTTANQANTTATTASSTATNAYNTASSLSYEWRVQGTIDGQPAGSVKLIGAKRINSSTGLSENYSNLIIDSNCTINGNLLVTGSVTGAQIGTGTNGVTTTNITTNAVSTANFVSGTNTTASPTSVLVTVRAGATVQVIANCSAGSSQSTEGYLSNIYGTTNVPSDPSTNVQNSGTLYIDRIIGGATTSSSFAIMGQFTGSSNSATGTYGGGFYGWNHFRNYVTFGQTGVAFYKNTTGSDQTVTFYTRSTLDPSVTLAMSVVELAR